MSKRPPKDAVMNLRAPRPLRDRVVRRATAKGVTLTAVALDAMTRGLDVIEEMEQRNVAA